MREITINGQKRETTGKKASKMMRKEGLVPCNLYGEKKDGKGLPEAVAFSVPFTEIR
jgi:large subunit ribosomal protein L25